MKKKLREARKSALKSYNFSNPGFMTPTTWAANCQVCLIVKDTTTKRLEDRSSGQAGIHWVIREQECKRAVSSLSLHPESQYTQHPTPLKPESPQTHSFNFFLDQSLCSKEVRALLRYYFLHVGKCLFCFEQNPLCCDIELNSLQGSR